MNLSHNPAPAEIMHIDLNSAFAMTEQQANPLLRHRPVGVTNRLNDYSICIAASYEAKALGIGVGTRNAAARRSSSRFVMLEADPSKYQYVHRRLRTMFSEYAPLSYMKSIDEGIIDFRNMRGVLKGRGLEDIAAEIKQRIREEIGDYMTVNIGIGQNRWAAKLGASFMKPNGLYTIDASSVEAVYGCLRLEEFPYIARKLRTTLNQNNIYSPLEFYRAPEVQLTRQVFKSINGHHWYLKLRGYETEVESEVRTVGRDYVLEYRTSDRRELATLLHKAADKVARRLARNNLAARGLLMQFGYDDEAISGWRGRRMYGTAARRGDQLYMRALQLYDESPQNTRVKHITMTAYAVEPCRHDQLTLYDDGHARQERIEDAINTVNNKYGERVLMPAAVLASKNEMKDKIPFGTIRYFE
jgi:DNA polymerase-4